MSDHLVIFYHRDADFLEKVTGFLAQGLEQGEPCVVIATEGHRHAIAAELTKRGMGSKLTDCRAYRTLDAAETLSKYMVQGWPNAEKFAEVIEPVLMEASQGGSKPLCLFGEMVALEFEAGNAEAAIRIEELWNGLARRHKFSLLCAYPIGRASKVHDYTSLIRVCAEHHQAAVPSELWTAEHLSVAESEQE